jgi:hypothetical protein
MGDGACRYIEERPQRPEIYRGMMVWNGQRKYAIFRGHGGFEWPPGVCDM